MTTSDWISLTVAVVGGIYCIIQIGDRLWKNKQRKEDKGADAADRVADRAVVREVGERMHCSDRVEEALVELAKQVTNLTVLQAEFSTSVRLNSESAQQRHNEILRELDRMNGK